MKRQLQRSHGDGQGVWKVTHSNQEAFRESSKIIRKTCQENTKTCGTWSWATCVVKHLGLQDAWWISPTFSLLSIQGLMKFYISPISACIPWSCQQISMHIQPFMSWN